MPRRWKGCASEVMQLHETVQKEMVAIFKRLDGESR